MPHVPRHNLDVPGLTLETSTTHTMRRNLLWMCAVVPLWACTSEPKWDVSGLWDLSESVTSDNGISCEATGELLLSQSSNGKSFTGQRTRTATCTGAPEGFSIDGGHTVIMAEVTDDGVVFEVDFCDYVGTFSDNNQLAGTFTCPDGLGQQPVLFTGTWSATRS